MGETTRPFRYDLNQIPYDYAVEVRNRFRGLDLIDRVPDELWMEVHETVQKTGSKTMCKKKKCNKGKRLSEEALQIAVKRREVKSKGGKEGYTHLNRMGKTRDLFQYQGLFICIGSLHQVAKVLELQHQSFQ